MGDMPNGNHTHVIAALYPKLFNFCVVKYDSYFHVIYLTFKFIIFSQTTLLTLTDWKATGEEVSLVREQGWWFISSSLRGCWTWRRRRGQGIRSAESALKAVAGGWRGWTAVPGIVPLPGICSFLHFHLQTAIWVRLKAAVTGIQWRSRKTRQMPEVVSAVYDAVVKLLPFLSCRDQFFFVPKVAVCNQCTGVQSTEGVVGICGKESSLPD